MSGRLTNTRNDPGAEPVNFTDAISDSFDGQAAIFDHRAGLPAEHCRNIADAVVEISKAVEGDLIFEIGSGTGQIGQWFSARMLYLGLDKSAQMLREFQHRFDGGAVDRILIRADANASWPLANASARVIFSSRTMHRLNLEHVASEVFRVASPDGATLIIGRVERDPASVKAQLSKQMNERLRQHGFEGRRGEQRGRKLFEICRQRGAEIVEPITVANWKVLASPEQSLDSWRCVAGLGGISIPTETKDEILKELEVWAKKVFGRLDQQFESDETYTLSPLRVPPAQAD
jgi:ubiquinone/menaquinone biosynthesis C-methylase UbiE